MNKRNSLTHTVSYSTENPIKPHFISIFRGRRRRRRRRRRRGD
jgi:hypothetical protein